MSFLPHLEFEDIVSSVTAALGEQGFNYATVLEKPDEISTELENKLSFEVWINNPFHFNLKFVSSILFQKATDNLNPSANLVSINTSIYCEPDDVNKPPYSEGNFIFLFRKRGNSLSAYIPSTNPRIYWNKEWNSKVYHFYLLKIKETVLKTTRTFDA